MVLSYCLSSDIRPGFVKGAVAENGLQALMMGTGIPPTEWWIAPCFLKGRTISTLVLIY